MPEQSMTISPVIKETEVAAPAEVCFTTFVDRFATWWPPEHRIGDRTIVRFTIEPRIGGRCYDVDTAGGVCQWGTVLALEPPTRVVLAWHIQGDWTIDHDPARQSEIEVTFTAIDEDRTAVRLEHRDLERHGPGAAGVRSGIDGPGGWAGLLARFRDVAEGRPPSDLPR
jgi:uncharacterized protein YndB with AHSA1/START domain